MTDEQWKQIKHFSPKEQWGDPYKMSFDLLKRLDALRKFVNQEIIIHCGYATDGHSENSQHYFGKAVDFHIKRMSLIDQYLAAERFMFTGLGLYPDWNHPGLHCDVRFKNYEESQDRWAKLNGIYILLNEDTIRKIIKKEI